MSNKQKIEETQARLDAHNRKNAVKHIATAVAINIVAPVVAVVATQAILNHLNKDK